MSRSLDQPIPEPTLHPGFHYCPVGGEAEIKAYIALHRAAFDTKNMIAENRWVIMSAPDYLLELDLVFLSAPVPLFC